MSVAPLLKAHPVDLHVGHRMRSRRKLLGMSQTELADRLGLTPQQVQRYERGVDPMVASQIYEIAWILSVPPTDLFQGLVPTPAQGAATASPSPRSQPEGLVNSNDAEALAELFAQIGSKTTRRAVIEVVRGLVSAK